MIVGVAPALENGRAAVVALGVLGAALTLWVVPRSETKVRLVGAGAVTFLVAYLSGTVAATAFLDQPLRQVGDGVFERVQVKVDSHPQTPSTPWGSNQRTFRARVADARVADAGWSGAQVWVSLEDFPADLPDPVLGEQWEVFGKLTREDWLSPPYVAALRGSRFKLQRSAPPWQYLSAHVRNKLGQEVEGFGPAGALIQGMSVGDDSGLPREAKQDMLTCSLTHLTAVSGSHVAATLAVLNVVTRGRRKTRAAVTVTFLVVLVGVVGPTPSVIRSSAMSALATWGMLRRRPAMPLSLLAAVVLVTVLVAPWMALSLGFALSVIATAGIVTASRPLEKQLLRLLPSQLRGRGLVRAVSSAVAVTASAQAATVPLLPLVNPWLPTWGLIANLLVAPVVAPLTVLSVGVAATGWWAGPLAHVFGLLARPLATWVLGVARVVASFPGARMVWPAGIEGAIFALCGLVLTVLAVKALPRLGVLIRRAHNELSRQGLSGRWQ